MLKDTSKTRLGTSPKSPLEVVMARQGIGDFSQDSGMILILIEDDQCCLRIPVSRVPQKLFDRLKERFRARPELAFGDKGVASIASDEDVGFPCVVESLARGLSFVVAVQMYEEVGS